MSIMQSLSWKVALLVVVVTLVLWRTACSACMRPIGHHRHWLAEHHMLSATTSIPDSKAARCFMNAICCCPVAKQLNLLPSRNSVWVNGDFSLEQVGIDISAPARMKVTHLMSIRPKKQARERLKTRSPGVVCSLLAMLRNRKSVRKSTNISPWVLVMHCLLMEETRCWNTDWQCKTHLLGQCHMSSFFLCMYRSLYTGSIPTQMPLHAYTEWKECLHESFSRLGAYVDASASAGFFVGWSCTG